MGAALADWFENTALLRVIDTYDEWKYPPSYAVGPGRAGVGSRTGRRLILCRAARVPALALAGRRPRGRQEVVDLDE
jgi:hypothetical protein